jgi:La-related protein 7
LTTVPVGVIASFRKMKKLVQDQSIIEAALRTSSKLVIFCPFVFCSDGL